MQSQGKVIDFSIHNGPDTALANTACLASPLHIVS